MPQGHDFAGKSRMVGSHVPFQRPTNKGYARSPPSTTLPPPLQHALPSCAYSCLAEHVGQQYNCPYNDFECLCLEYSAAGFSLGELAFICIREECPQQGLDMALKSYNVCSNQKGAVVATHSVLTIQIATTQTSRKTATTTTTTTTSPAPLQTNTSTTSYTRGQSSLSSATAAAGPSSPTSPVEPTNMPMSSASHASSSSTTMKVVGVTVGAVGSILLAVGAMCLFVFLRRRKRSRDRDRDSSYDFVDKAPSDLSFLEDDNSHARAPEQGQWPLPGSTSEKRTTKWPGNPAVNPDYPPAHAQQFDFQFEPVESVPHSARSHRYSQLLPEKPDSVLNHAPYSDTTQWPVVSSRPTAMVQVPGDSSLVSFQPEIPSFPPPPPLSYDPSRAKFTPPGVSQRSARWETPQAERLSLDIPHQAFHNHVVAPATSSTVGVSDESSCSEEESEPARLTEEGRKSPNGSLLNYYSSQFAGTTSLGSPSDATEDQTADPRPTIIVTRPTFQSQSTRRMSGDSHTTFDESSDDQTSTTKARNTNLAHARRPPPKLTTSPIRDIKYPKVPRSANQAVARSPKAEEGPRTSFTKSHELALSRSEPILRSAPTSPSNTKRRMVPIPLQEVPDFSGKTSPVAAHRTAAARSGNPSPTKRPIEAPHGSMTGVATRDHAYPLNQVNTSDNPDGYRASLRKDHKPFGAISSKPAALAHSQSEQSLRGHRTLKPTTPPAPADDPSLESTATSTRVQQLHTQPRPPTASDPAAPGRKPGLPANPKRPRPAAPPGTPPLLAQQRSAETLTHAPEHKVVHFAASLPSKTVHGLPSIQKRRT